MYVLQSNVFGMQGVHEVPCLYNLNKEYGSNQEFVSAI